MSEIGNLLAKSRAEHAHYQRANRAGDKALERRSIQAALSLREQAQALDPTHSDDGWLEDPVSHDAFVDFYSLWLQETATH